MFGHQSNNDQAVSHGDPQADATLSNGLEPETVSPTAVSAPVVDDQGGYASMTDLPTVTEQPVATPPVVDPTPAPAPAPAPVVSAPVPAPAGGTDELLDLKQSALHELSPLIGHLEQSPEEKFRTTMMMIQASDDQTLLTTAYEAAKAISDEKARAQALLDIVNEINYFTQQSNN
jgi:hypothetical protein